MNYSNSQRAGVILNFTALLFGAYLKKGIAAIAKRTAMVEVNTVCPLIAFQPEVPEELKKLRKF